MPLRLFVAQLRRWITQSANSAHRVRAERLVVACHFFGDHSPFGFWDDQQLDRVPELLETVRNDGFNTIVLVVPFEPFIEQQPKLGLNPWYWERLRLVIKMAHEANLQVILRLCYPHSTSPDNQTYLVHRQMKMLDEQRTRTWLATYFQKVAEVVRDSPAYAGAFLSWEDFWIVFDHPPKLAEVDRARIATEVELPGLATEWVNDAQIQKVLGAETSTWPTGIVPMPSSPAQVLWMKWFDHFLFDFVAGCAREFLPEITFEIRSDGHPIDVGGEVFWANFELLRDTQHRRYGYWGAYYGATNAGEVLTAHEAMRGLEYSLDVTNGTGKYANIVLEQFNIVDNTLVFSGAHARIQPGELPRFLSLAAPVFARRTAGYGLWTYRNYRENWLANSAFQRGLDGWSPTGAVEAVRDQPQTKHSVSLAPNAGISQSIHGMLRLQAPLSIYPAFNLLLHIADTAGNALTHETVLVRVGDTNGVPAGHEGGRLRYVFPKEVVSEGQFEFSLRNESTQMLTISEMCFYAYEQLGGLYDADHQTLPLAEDIRKFNLDLVEAHRNAPT